MVFPQHTLIINQNSNNTTVYNKNIIGIVFSHPDKIATFKLKIYL